PNTGQTVGASLLAMASYQSTFKLTDTAQSPAGWLPQWFYIDLATGSGEVFVGGRHDQDARPQTDRCCSGPNTGQTVGASLLAMASYQSTFKPTDTAQSPAG
ncbi:hypothetical protein ACIOZM_27480, partial [Pseudomonas sp. NPDC087346]|uniref:hypothetical protein n=1 Tax=Pseudomonas sp. NPDC087346 TaxID=3364438 RepID=UPI003826DA78